MSPNMANIREISDDTWDRTEHDWSDKSFYYVSVTFLLGKPLGLDGKLEELNRDVRKGGYKIKNPMILIQHGKFKGRIMIEIEKKDLYDSQVFTYDPQTACDTIVHNGGISGLGKGIDRLRERVAARRISEPREIYYMYQPDPNSTKTVLFAIT